MRGNYLAQGFKRANKTFMKNKTSLFSFVFLSIASLLGKMFFLTAPVFQMFDLSIAEDSAESNEFNMFECFRDSDNPKSIWILLVINIIKFILIITGIGFILLITYFLFLLGLEIDGFTMVEHLSLYFIIPLIVASIGYIVFIISAFSPITYITRNIESKNLFTILYNNKLSMKFSMFSKVFCINFLYYIFMIGGPIIFAIVYIEYNLNFLLLIIFVICVMIYLLIMGYALLSKNISLYLFFKENVVIDATKTKKEYNKDSKSDEEKLSNVFNDSNAFD